MPANSSKKTKKYRVLKRHIDKATRILWDEHDHGTEMWARSCPIAQAIREKTKKRVSVEETDVMIGNIKYHHDGAFYVMSFDVGDSLDPFTVTIRKEE